MLALKSVLVAIVLVWSGAASAQAIPDYDPSYIPADLRQTRLADCKMSMAVDRSWPQSVKHTKRSDGRRHTEYKYSLNPDYWKTVGGVGDVPTANLHLLLSMSCHKNALRPKFFEAYVRGFQSSFSKKRRHKIGAVQSLNIPTVGRVLYFTGEIKDKGGSVSDIGQFFTVYKGQDIWVYVTVQRTPDRKFSRKLKPGFVYDETMNSGQRFKFRLKTAARQQRGTKAISGLRTKSQNTALIHAFLTSLRGL